MHTDILCADCAKEGFEQITTDHDESDLQISYIELLKFIERSGIDIYSKLKGYQRKEIKTLGEFLGGVQDSLLINTKYLYLQVG